MSQQTIPTQQPASTETIPLLSIADLRQRLKTAEQALSQLQREQADPASLRYGLAQAKVIGYASLIREQEARFNIAEKNFVRRYYASSGEFETAAEHSAWCEGCTDCWSEDSI